MSGTHEDGSAVARGAGSGVVERAIDVGGRALWVRCAGDGMPCVVLEAPAGSTSGEWELVLPAVAAFARVCAYDRAGSGRSEPDPEGHPLLVSRRAGDLCRLLEAVAPGPCVLVGHSWGGPIVRAAAARLRERVAGMVLVDPTHEAWPARMAALVPAAMEGGPPPEVWDDLAAEMRAAGDLGDLPLVVVTSGQRPPFPPDWPADALWAAHQELMDATARLSTRGERVVAERSGHAVPREQPEAIVEAVRRVVEVARARR